jgi:hypothetical protein
MPTAATTRLLRSLVFETPPLDTPIELLGAAIVTLDVASDRPIATSVGSTFLQF